MGIFQCHVSFPGCIVEANIISPNQKGFLYRKSFCPESEVMIPISEVSEVYIYIFINGTDIQYLHE